MKKLAKETTEKSENSPVKASNCGGLTPKCCRYWIEQWKSSHRHTLGDLEHQTDENRPQHLLEICCCRWIPERWRPVRNQKHVWRRNVWLQAWRWRQTFAGRHDCLYLQCCFFLSARDRDHLWEYSCCRSLWDNFRVNGFKEQPMSGTNRTRTPNFSVCMKRLPSCET